LARLASGGGGSTPSRPAPKRSAPQSKNPFAFSNIAAGAKQPFASKVTFGNPQYALYSKVGKRGDEQWNLNHQTPAARRAYAPVGLDLNLERTVSAPGGKDRLKKIFSSADLPTTQTLLYMASQNPERAYSKQISSHFKNGLNKTEAGLVGLSGGDMTDALKASGFFGSHAKDVYKKRESGGGTGVGSIIQLPDLKGLIDRAPSELSQAQDNLYKWLNTHRDAGGLVPAADPKQASFMPSGVTKVSDYAGKIAKRGAIDAASLIPATGLSAYQLGRDLTTKGPVETVKKDVVEPVKQVVEHPIRSFENAPVTTALMATGAYGALGRVGGGLMRATADVRGVPASVSAAADVARPSIYDPMRDILIARRYSPNVITRTAQRLAEKGLEKQVSSPITRREAGVKTKTKLEDQPIRSTQVNVPKQFGKPVDPAAPKVSPFSARGAKAKVGQGIDAAWEARFKSEARRSGNERAEMSLIGKRGGRQVGMESGPGEPAQFRKVGPLVKFEDGTKKRMEFGTTLDKGRLIDPAGKSMLDLPKVVGFREGGVKVGIDRTAARVKSVGARRNKAMENDLVPLVNRGVLSRQTLESGPKEIRKALEAEREQILAGQKGATTFANSNFELKALREHGDEMLSNQANLELIDEAIKHVDRFGLDSEYLLEAARKQAEGSRRFQKAMTDAGGITADAAERRPFLEAAQARGIAERDPGGIPTLEALQHRAHVAGVRQAERVVNEARRSLVKAKSGKTSQERSIRDLRDKIEELRRERLVSPTHVKDLMKELSDARRAYERKPERVAELERSLKSLEVKAARLRGETVEREGASARKSVKRLEKMLEGQKFEPGSILDKAQKVLADLAKASKKSVHLDRLDALSEQAAGLVAGRRVPTNPLEVRALTVLAEMNRSSRTARLGDLEARIVGLRSEIKQARRDGRVEAQAVVDRAQERLKAAGDEHKSGVDSELEFLRSVLADVKVAHKVEKRQMRNSAKTEVEQARNALAQVRKYRDESRPFANNKTTPRWVAKGESGGHAPAISNIEIANELRRQGVDPADVAYVSNRPGKGGNGDFYQRDTRDRAGYQAQAYEGRSTAQRIAFSDAEALRDQNVRSNVIRETIQSYDSFMRQAALGPETLKRYKTADYQYTANDGLMTLDEAKHIQAIADNKFGVHLELVRAMRGRDLEDFANSLERQLSSPEIVGHFRTSKDFTPEGELAKSMSGESEVGQARSAMDSFDRRFGVGKPSELTYKNLDEGTRNVRLVPSEELAIFLRHSEIGAPGLPIVGAAFRRAVLPLSTKWLAGNFAEAELRKTIAGVVPLYDVVKGRIDRQFMDAMRVYDPVLAAEFEAQAGGGLLFAAQTRAVTRTERGLRAQKGEALGGRATQVVYNGIRGVVNGLTDQIFSLNSKYEHSAKRQVRGKAFQRELRDFTGSWVKSVKAQQETIDAILKHWDTNPKVAQAKAAQFGRYVDETLGKYSKFNPELRNFIQGYAPFVAWTLNSLKFMFHLMPVKHPVLTGVIASTHSVLDPDIKDWIAGKGPAGAPRGPLRYNIDTGGDLMPEWLKSITGIHDGALLDINRLTPVGAFTDSPAKTLLNNLTPQIASAQAIIRGRNPITGREMRDQNGDPIKDPFTLAWLATYSLAEVTFPGLSLARRALEGGKSGADNSTLFRPRNRNNAYDKGAGVKLFFPLPVTYLNGSSGGGSIADEINQYQQQGSQAASIADEINKYQQSLGK
jgi:hypothetical protein